LVDAEGEELVFVLPDLVLDVFGLFLQCVPSCDLGPQRPIPDMPQSVFYCDAILVTWLEHLQRFVGELWVCIISVVNWSGVNLTAIHGTVHLQSGFYIRVVNV
jgi:hypothetical protein